MNRVLFIVTTFIGVLLMSCQPTAAPKKKAPVAKAELTGDLLLYPIVKKWNQFTYQFVLDTDKKNLFIGADYFQQDNLGDTLKIANFATSQLTKGKKYTMKLEYRNSPNPEKVGNIFFRAGVFDGEKKIAGGEKYFPFPDGYELPAVVKSYIAEPTAFSLPVDHYFFSLGSEVITLPKERKVINVRPSGDYSLYLKFKLTD